MYDESQLVLCATCFTRVAEFKLDSHGYVCCDKCDDQKGVT